MDWDDKIAAMRGSPILKIILILAALTLLAGLAYQLPPVNKRLSWRLDFARAYLRGVIDPVQSPPTALPEPQVQVTNNVTSTPTSTPQPSPTVTEVNTPTPTISPTPLPEQVILDPPRWEYQDINNCGPAALTMYLRYYGWEGDQTVIAEALKPQREDRNVNVEELAYFVRTNVGWLNFEYRVGSDLEMLKEFLANGIPVMIEESFYFEGPYWPNDDLWAAHYQVLTGYDEAKEVFIGQDSYHGANQEIPYEVVDEYWQAFNRVVILIYLPWQEETVKAILGPNWDPATSRETALERSKREIEAAQDNPFAWFNLGSNLTYFERYTEAARAFDEARRLGLPQRMLRYQFTPFIAYFHSGKTDDLMALTEYALKITPNAEEALLWHGWGLYRQGDNEGALGYFQQALYENPNYSDAQYAISYLGANE